jgi:hypothetical protein
MNSPITQKRIRDKKQKHDNDDTNLDLHLDDGTVTLTLNSIANMCTSLRQSGDMSNVNTLISPNVNVSTNTSAKKKQHEANIDTNRHR